MSTKTDSELICDVQAGDRRAFEILMRRHDKFLLKVVLRMTRDLDAAEDIVQESFIKAYKKLSLFEGRSTFRSWLYQIGLNTTRNRYRRASRESIGIEHLDIVVEEESEAKVIEGDVRAAIQREVELLPARQREALSLRIFDDLSFKEIADVMQCPYDTAKANYRHALLKLRERLGGDSFLRGWVGSTRLSLMELAGSTLEVER